jgi:hypothetical protein
MDISIEKEPDPNRRKSSIKSPRVSWATEEKLVDVREYFVDDENLSETTTTTASASGATSTTAPHQLMQGEHRSFESARMHELQQERSVFMRIPLPRPPSPSLFPLIWELQITLVRCSPNY